MQGGVHFHKKLTAFLSVGEQADNSLVPTRPRRLARIDVLPEKRAWNRVEVEPLPPSGSARIVRHLRLDGRRG